MGHRIPFSAILWIILFSVSLSCTTRQLYSYLEPVTINKSLASIDSFLVDLSGYGPTEIVPEDYAYPKQATIDAATQTWSTFVGLCKKNRFKDAYEFYSKDNNSGDFFVYMRHSSPRYQFISHVLSPMVLEYEPIDTAVTKLQGLLEMEFYLEEFTMKYGKADTSYIPESFPMVTTDLAAIYAKQGMVNEAFNLMEPFFCAVDGLHRDPAYTQFCLALFVSDIFSNSGNLDKARETLEYYKTYTQKNIDSIVDSNEIKHYFSIIDGALDEIDDKKKSLE